MDIVEMETWNLKIENTKICLTAGNIDKELVCVLRTWQLEQIEQKLVFAFSKTTEDNKWKLFLDSFHPKVISPLCGIDIEMKQIFSPMKWLSTHGNPCIGGPVSIDYSYVTSVHAQEASAHSFA